MRTTKNNFDQNSFRISSGLFKGSRFKFPSSEGLRPTKSIVKETLFNWLQFSIKGSRVLDLFSGSGSLAFEAISREAMSVTMVEKDKTVFDFLKTNSNNLKTDTSIQLINDNAFNYLDKIINNKFDIIFLDPPFFKNYLGFCLSKMEVNQIIGTKTKIYIESEFEMSENFLKKNLNSCFKLKKNKKSGDVYYSMIEII